MELSSGELLYRANNIGGIGRALYADINEDFWQFLDHAAPGGTNSEEMLHTSKSIGASVESYILKLRHRVLTVRKSIEHSRQQIFGGVEYENKTYLMELDELKNRFDSEAMHLVLQYYAIIQEEIAASRRKLVTENLEKVLLFKQAAVLRDIRLYACHLMVESRGKLGFTMLPPESQQFARCVKAVMDNVQDDLYDSRFRSRIKVLNVFKLQNTFLSGKLQAASERVSNGKIKGLFCCLPQDQFYAFSVFGLYGQVVPYRASANLQQLAGELFSTAWFHAEPPPGIAAQIRHNSEIAQALRMAGSAAKLAVQRVAAAGNHDAKGQPAADEAKSSAKTTASNPPPHIYRFSRYSTISNLHSFSRAALEGGVFLALCRVLVVKQLTVEGAIGDVEILSGLQQGCDCIYTSATEEYVLLQPKYVLPEFLMHVQFPAEEVLSGRYARTGGGSPGKGHSSPSPSKDRGTAEVAGAEGAITRIPAVLSTSQPVSSMKIRSGNRTDADRTGADDSLFPLENLLLGNAVTRAEQESGQASRVVYEQEQEPGSEMLDTHVTLLRKQHIVESLQRAVQHFQREKDALLIRHASRIHAQIG